MKIFISYRRAEDNKSFIVGTIHKMIADAFGANEVFRDLNDIAGGAEWRKVLEHEINTCRVMLVIIGPEWANLTNSDGQKRLEDPNDVTRWEVETGLNRSAEGAATVIPVLVTGAGVPNAGDLPPILRPLLEKNVVQIRNYPDFERDMDELIHDIRTSVGFAVDDIEIDESFEPRTVRIAEGPFKMGIPSGDEITPAGMPQHEVNLPVFRIGVAPVTNAQYAVFVEETRTRAMPILGWVGQKPHEDRQEHPVAGVTFKEARDYCVWLSKKTNREYMIPNEAQWEKACRGGSTSRYPWGDDPAPERSNHGKGSIAAVNAYLAQNDFGMLDLVGNVRQWTSSLWGESRVKPDDKFGYPWKNDRRNDINASSQILRVVRGSSFAEDDVNLFCTSRKGQLPGDAGWTGAGISFRVAMKV
ncbi:MAG TPA: SUMF1/EgtB/PvdO family nonheme iron enzyme [Anaerolineales bacterium]|nr:SUMF1/EgtB/PvdO family nonheme iron enzyme [Anaerolineales bacterium]